MERILLASDMDGTVIPLHRRPGAKKSVRNFKAFVNAQGLQLLLAYVTGRDLNLALEGIKTWGLPTPRLLACDVGTTMYVRRGDKWHCDQMYRRMMRESFGGCEGADIISMLGSVDALTLQETEKQAEFKVSYYVSLHQNKKQLIRSIKGRLARRGVRSNLVYSVDQKKKKGLLDILPSNVAKDTAVRYLQAKQKIPTENVIYAGDSGNDLLAFLSGYKSIIVANTPPTVKKVVRHSISRKPALENKIYFAKERSTRGVLEGCRHFLNT